ncbi:hypothetical protein [Corynebacterium kalidii]|uniref:DUF5642 domain-containing protein n=1 Tax=Corynebacterium kalidii TaxID=2931982 RepID=A0A9X1WH87_9CORY|nr:hypothetical protein [Corynebacterium kalidii]MCJ7859114.1 hypothetical protein [Corynebacterium kalidii]
MTDTILRRTCAALTAAGLLVSVAACTSGDDSGTTSATSKDPSDMMLTDSDTPAGWEWSDASETLDDGDEGDMAELLESADAVVTDPEQCASIAPSVVSMLAVLHANPETTAAAGFLPQDSTDPGVVNAMVSTDPENTGMAMPDDFADCETFTQSSDLDREMPPVTLHAQVTDAEIVGAEDVHVITVVRDTESQAGDNPMSVVVGTVEGVAFRVDASGIDEPQILMDLADRQVDRIRGNDPDGR